MKLKTVVAVALTVAVVDGIADARKKKQKQERDRERAERQWARDQAAQREYDRQRAAVDRERRRRLSTSSAAGSYMMPTYYDPSQSQVGLQRRFTVSSQNERYGSGSVSSRESHGY
ncbi:hypothetical protein OC846_004690 [Tilletia horrida]|uniref:Uncharacterized protein n=1 Tax=Tilletia horrida TaxID=155126 RepID=A0AAN6GLT5_9BASI|nr:hypothetical protein OC845_004999 [Tilletia horrida]KAK0547867.1 hypothetical protein OC846_004690 [Tilletia horrida]KAK0567996.1 hypothetical protein OC861_002377 [Tilletia horrida]